MKDIRIRLFLLFLCFFLSGQLVPAFASPLQIGWYTGTGVSDMTRLDKEKAAGQTVMVGYYADPASIAEYLNKLNQLGVKAFLQVDPKAVEQKDTSALTNFVNIYKNNAAIAGWYLYDEPEFNNVPNGALKTGYQTIKAADPSHPIVTAYGNGWCSYLAGYGSDIFDWTDIVQFDKYPISDQAEFAPVYNKAGTSVDNSMWEYSHTVQDCQGWLKNHGNKKYQVVAQGFNWGGTGPTGKPTRNPTYREERFFTFYPLIAHVDGLIYYIDYTPHPDLFADVNRTMKEATTIATALVNGVYNDPSVTVSHSQVAYLYGSDGSATYLIAANDAAKNDKDVGSSVTATFTLPTSVTSLQATLVFDNYNPSTQNYQTRSIPLSKNSSGHPTFTDTFTPFQVHIYQLNGTTVEPTQPAISPTVASLSPTITSKPPTPTSKSYTLPPRPFWWNQIPSNLRDFLEELYILVFYFHRQSNLQHLLKGVFPTPTP